MLQFLDGVQLAGQKLKAVVIGRLLQVDHLHSGRLALVSGLADAGKRTAGNENLRFRFGRKSKAVTC